MTGGEVDFIATIIEYDFQTLDLFSLSLSI